MKKLNFRVRVFLTKPIEGMPENRDIIADVLSDIMPMSVTEEQYEYLCKEAERNEYCCGSVYIEECEREDFQQMTKLIEKTFLEFLRQQYVEGGFCEELIDERINSMYVSIQALYDQYVWDIPNGIAYEENGIIYRRVYYGDPEDREVVACTDPKIEKFSSENVIKIADSAFAGCYYLTEVNIPNAVDIGDRAFLNCTCLRKVVLSDKLEEIEPYTFDSCHFLHDINVPKSLESIGENAFYCCVNLDKFDLPPERTVTVGEDAFAYTPVDYLSHNQIYEDENEDEYENE